MTRAKALEGIKFYSLTGLPMSTKLSAEVKRALDPQMTEDERSQLRDIHHEIAVRLHMAMWN